MGYNFKSKEGKKIELDGKTVKIDVKVKQKKKKKKKQFDQRSRLMKPSKGRARNADRELGSSFGIR